MGLQEFLKVQLLNTQTLEAQVERKHFYYGM